MKNNVGRTDKLVRIVIGLAIAIAGFYYQSWWGLLAIIPLLTGLVGMCPLYKLVGVNTCSTSISQ